MKVGFASEDYWHVGTDFIQVMNSVKGVENIHHHGKNTKCQLIIFPFLQCQQAGLIYNRTTAKVTWLVFSKSEILNANGANGANDTKKKKLDRKSINLKASFGLLRLFYWFVGEVSRFVIVISRFVIVISGFVIVI